MYQEAQALNIPAASWKADVRIFPRPTSRSSGAEDRDHELLGVLHQNPAIDPADFLVMDDAHLAEHCLHSLFSVQISAHSHESLFKTLVSELRERFPEYTVLSDALAGSEAASGTPPELLLFVDQELIVERVREIIDASPSLKTETDLAFRWKRLRNSLREANFYFGIDQIWIYYTFTPLSGFHIIRT